MRIGAALSGSLVLTLLAQPALAQDNGAVRVEGSIDVTCVFNGEVFPTGGIAAGGEQIAPGSTATSTLNLADSRDQAIGLYRFKCNTPAALISITTLNDFKLLNPSGGARGQIPYLLKVPGLAQLSSGFTTTTFYIDRTGPLEPIAERTLLVDVGNLNLFNLLPGVYTDQVIVTVQPSQ